MATTKLFLNLANSSPSPCHCHCQSLPLLPVIASVTPFFLSLSPPSPSSCHCHCHHPCCPATPFLLSMLSPYICQSFRPVSPFPSSRHCHCNPIPLPMSPPSPSSHHCYCCPPPLSPIMVIQSQILQVSTGVVAYRTGASQRRAGIASQQLVYTVMNGQLNKNPC